ncbi:MAG: hypothetical protein R3B82_05895 [Sandaracinaceae bacterium]
MTRQRMEDLLEALGAAGWRLLDEREHPKASPDPFVLEDDAVTWAMSRADPPVVIELQLCAFGDLGEPTRRLRDVLYCQVVGRDERLYFTKRARPEWRESLMTFVRHLDSSRRGDHEDERDPT